jgi:carboxypeptidase C (cathepsin A)
MLGCVQLKAPQLENLYQKLTPEVDPLHEYAWVLTAGDYRTTVYLFNINNQQYFANDSGDIVLIKGQVITEIRQLAGLTDTIKIQDINAQLRRQLVNNTLYESQSCNAWTTNNNITYTQVCKGAEQMVSTASYKNGQMVYLKQPISYLKRFIELTKQ